jgi:hypothetical protein
MDTKVSILTCVRPVKTFKKSEWISHSNTPEEINHREKSIINAVMEELGMFYYTISGCSQLLWEKKIASIPWYLNPLNQDLRAQPHNFACVFPLIPTSSTKYLTVGFETNTQKVIQPLMRRTYIYLMGWHVPLLYKI